MSENFSLSIKDNDPAQTDSSLVGRTGEKLAAEFLRQQSYALVAANFKVPVGRNNRGAVVTGEIDLIAYDRDVLCFIEVKTRTSDRFSSPLAAVNLRKQRQIIRAARMYRKIFRLVSVKCRYDVVSIVLEDTTNKNSPKIDLLQGFWTESKFSKSNWSDDL